MAEFVCKVADASGRIRQQVEAAQTEAEARRILADRGLFVYSVRPARGLAGIGGKSTRMQRTVRGADFLVFNQQFNTLIKAGLPILKSLDLLAERAAAPRLRPLLGEVRQRVRDGASLSEAMEAMGVFPKVYTTAVLAGEKSGNLSGVLDYYVAYQRVTTSFRRRLLASLVYPSLLVFVATLILTYIITYVIPEFAKLYSELNVALPFITLALVNASLEFRPWLFGGLVLAVAGSAAGVFWSRTETGGLALDRLKQCLPVVSDTWSKFQVSQFARTLSTLLTGGTPLVAALETSADAVGSRLFAAAITSAAGRVREGQALHASLAETKMFPGLTVEMVEVGESTGALAPMLTSVAEFYEEDVNLRLSALVGLVEPLILVFMGIVVAFILISLYLPIFTFSLAGGAR